MPDEEPRDEAGQRRVQTMLRRKVMAQHVDRPGWLHFVFYLRARRLPEVTSGSRQCQKNVFFFSEGNVLDGVQTNVTYAKYHFVKLNSNVKRVKLTMRPSQKNGAYALGLGAHGPLIFLGEERGGAFFSTPMG